MKLGVKAITAHLNLTYFSLLESVEITITASALSEMGTNLDYLNTEIMSSNHTQGMDVCARLFCVCVILCVGRT
jgi:hypothetical protein